MKLPEFSQADESTKPSATVFDIQRCSLQDGPGIRTTVFLKGCPLHCLWCHNPEALDVKPQLWYEEAKCVGCFRCLDVCESGAHFRDAGGHDIDFEKCTACGKCIDICAGEAVKIIGKAMTVDQAMEVVLRDRAYFDSSGGGITLSGGEPMAQFEFTLAMLKAAKAAGIHTCLETCGASSWRNYRTVLPFTDLFLFDYKVSDLKLHRTMVGCSNLVLLQNLNKLASLGARIVLRCPIIPTINDEDGHFHAIAALANKHPQIVGVEIMPYHNFGVSKRDRLGAAHFLPPIEPPSQAIQESWISRLHELGCVSAKIG
jgi:pyruvate formate lyase activating enzyme